MQNYIHDHRQKRGKYKTLLRKGKPREQLLTMQTGYRTLVISPINPGDFIPTDTHLQIANMILRKKIHMEAIREAHRPHDTDYIFNGYRTTASASKKTT